ncbi:MAG: VapC toxin family PIN domain ribonuclease [Deltaproteobacteria bacterium]|nr:MAG: VapC toxin family PIN domain ribonuclease [Deltaproteobacteria bacterium]
MKYMLDTNICIYIIKKKPAHVIERFRQTPISQIGISSITLSELEYGVAKSSKPDQNQFALAQFLAPLEISSYGDEAAQQYGMLRALLGKQGTPIGSLDMLIAAHGLSINCILVTNNEKEFNRVPNLKIDNWVK